VKLKVTNPANGEVAATLDADDPRSVRAKYMQSRAAQPGWARTPLKKRLEAIARFRDLVARESDRLARVLTTEVGKPIAQSRNELKGLLPRIDFFLEETARTLKPEKVSADAAMEERITHEPLGVVANISAWNYPWFVGSNVFVPALLAGNTVLYKPSEFASMTGLEIARLLHESGIPEDVFTPLVGGRETGAALLKQPVDGVFFTGSYATGRRIAEAVRWRMVKLQLELGGKDPVYVCDDVDIAKAAAGIADGAFYNTGQSCCSVERIYVNEKVFKPFVDAFVAEVKGYKRGDPVDDKTYIGPLTRAPQVKVLEAQVKDAKKKGAKVLTGGAPIRARGNWFEPTVLVDVNHTMDVMREESFRAGHRDHAGEERRRGHEAHERHGVRVDGRRLHQGSQAGGEDPRGRELGLGLLELLRPREPAAAVVGCGEFRHRPHAFHLRHRDLHAPEGVAPARRLSATRLSSCRARTTSASCAWLSVARTK
jgi:acyl-CoA reductase-like NAD-dependent aldehyde dehydrogenase